NPIRIPAGTILRDTISNSNVPRVTLNGAESFLISWTASYILQYQGQEVLNLENQKRQSMR
ncbi:1122_t:CDS:1, partial [Dentiscutata erythropus]